MKHVVCSIGPMRNALAAAVALALCCFAPAVARAESDLDRGVSSDQGPDTTTVRQGVTGRVSFASGQAVNEVLVQARSLDRPARPVPEIAIMTNRAGNYLWPLAAGRYEITFIHQGRRSAAREIDVSPQGVTRLDVQIPGK